MILGGKAERRWELDAWSLLLLLLGFGLRLSKGRFRVILQHRDCHRDGW